MVNWKTVSLGAGILLASAVPDPVPVVDELVTVPLGAKLVLDGARGSTIQESATDWV